jgi:hypothetical protein
MGAAPVASFASFASFATSAAFADLKLQKSFIGGPLQRFRLGNACQYWTFETGNFLKPAARPDFAPPRVRLSKRFNTTARWSP